MESENLILFVVGTINELADAVSKLQPMAETLRIVKEQKKDLIRLNQSQLYREGVLSTGEKLKPYRSKAYAEKKNAMNSLPGLGNPDLFLTGSFFRGMEVDVTGESFSIDSRDGKAANLEKKYSAQIFGLTPQSQEKYNQFIFYPRFQKYFTQQTGLKFS